MFSNLPVSKNTSKYVVVLLVLVFIAIAYFLVTRLSGRPTTSNVDVSQDNSSNAAFFVPPSSTSKQVEVTGEVIKIDAEEKTGATHKITDPGDGSILIYATTNDDKLNQQEGNIVKLVGSVPLNEEVNENTIMKVEYISFK